MTPDFIHMRRGSYPEPETMTKHFQLGAKLFASLAAVSMLAIPASAQTVEEIFFDPAVAAGDIDEFAISPDGTQIVMVADLGDGDQTYVASLNSGVMNTATLVSPAGVGDNDGGVAWTPDGLHVTARYAAGGATNEIFLVPADGSQTAQQLTFTGNNAFDPQISADGNSFFYSDGGSLFVTPIAGASATSSIQLNAGDISEIDTGSYAQVGSNIIFAGFSAPIPGAGNGDPETAFYLTAADGSTAASPTLISIDNFETNNPGGSDIDFVDVTSDGQTIVFRGDLTTDDQDELYSLSINGGDAVSLIAGTLRDDFDLNYFTISPDGSTIAFIGDYLTNGVAEAFVVPVTGGDPTLVSDSSFFDQENGFDVDFGGVDTLQFSPDGNSLYYLSDSGDDGRFRLFRASINAVPEPTALPLILAAASTILFRRRK